MKKLLGYDSGDSGDCTKLREDHNQLKKDHATLKADHDELKTSTSNKVKFDEERRNSGLRVFQCQN